MATLYKSDSDTTIMAFYDIMFDTLFFVGLDFDKIQYYSLYFK